MRGSELYSLGLDFGTSAVRALIVSLDDGREVGTGTSPYRTGVNGVLTDPANPHVARQHPADYPVALTEAVREALEAAHSTAAFDAERIVGIGISATASTPLPVDGRLEPLALREAYRDDLDAMAWLWKDHSSHAEAQEITTLARELLPEHIARVGGTYSSEWFYAKLLRCVRTAPGVLETAEGWVELGDYIAALLTGASDPKSLPRNVCAAGHKALYHERLGPPPPSFFARLDAKLGRWLEAHPQGEVRPAGEPLGPLSPEWAERLGLRAGIAVSMAAVDAHLGAVGAGIRPGILVKILGTSGCDMLVHPAAGDGLETIPGLCGMVRDSILPGFWGLEAGQAAVGDLFGWFVREFAQASGLDHPQLTERAAKLRPGESGLLALDWNNGNRSILADPLLTGCLVGSTLGTKIEEVYRALIEATAFGARVIVDRLLEYGVSVDGVVACGGIAEKNRLLLQIYADVLRRPIRLSRSRQTCALGAAICGAVAAAKRDTSGNIPPEFERFDSAEAHMTGLKDIVYEPAAERSAVYDELYELYVDLHDAFGRRNGPAGLYHVMKRLLEIQSRVRLEANCGR